ncbi:uncharacterized protein C8Q71DRAFT_791632 [Rhodofomes roseus]|uniref:C2H2-type domain-containing protein n=1 Tax=Rhodofomes roseus TaxID=34475 RepID=A0ABQ8JYC1_9APHY|nr:uncharacterized protein C8Q71DRAFT_791632 [Rhodofomes roseus]KAH9829082.1 hypothetical protein C8Q71DRAFT_791632 [Rhodofomes roseus]
MGLGDILTAGENSSYAKPGSNPPGVDQRTASLPQPVSSTSTASRIASTSYATTPCCYSEGECASLTEDDLSRGVPGVRQHLWKYHQRHFVRDRHGKYLCQWRTGPGREVCAMAISDLDNLARHMASVHLRLTTQKCPRCGSQFSRTDALLRHCKRCY